MVSFFVEPHRFDRLSPAKKAAVGCITGFTALTIIGLPFAPFIWKGSVRLLSRGQGPSLESLVAADILTTNPRLKSLPTIPAQLFAEKIIGLSEVPTEIRDIRGGEELPCKEITVKQVQLMEIKRNSEASLKVWVVPSNLPHFFHVVERFVDGSMQLSPLVFTQAQIARMELIKQKRSMGLVDEHRLGKLQMLNQQVCGLLLFKDPSCNLFTINPQGDLQQVNFMELVAFKTELRIGRKNLLISL